MSNEDGEPIDDQGFLLTQRQQLRENRLEHYNRVAIRGTPENNLESLKDEINCFVDKKTNLFKLREYLPSRTCGRVPSLEHYQLRHNLCYAMNHTLVYNAVLPGGTDTCGIRTWSLLERKSSVLVDLYKEGKGNMKLCSLSVLDDLVVAGEIRGQLLIKRLFDEDSSSTTTNTTTDTLEFMTLSRDDNGITNFIRLFESKSSGAITAICCNNDNHLRIVDIATKSIIHAHHLLWAPNCASLSQDKKLALVVGDSLDAIIIAVESGKQLYSLPGHLDHSFSCDWSADGIYFATGSQDQTTRLYDSRFIGQSPLTVLPASMTAFRSVHFSPSSKFLLMTESADFLHIVDLQRTTHSLELDFFGEISGATWNFSGDCVYAANSDLKVGGVFEYEQVIDVEMRAFDL